MLAVLRAGKPAAAPAISASKRIDLLMEKIERRKLRTEKALRAVIAPFVDGLRADYTTATMQLQLTRARNEIVARFGENHPAYRLLLSGPSAARLGGVGLGLSGVEVDAQIAHGRRRINQYRRKQIPITSSAARQLVKQARALIGTRERYDSPRHSSNGKPRWDMILAGLMLLTGRRPIELFHLGTFDPIRKKPNHLMFGGQAKTRDSENARTTPYEIPVLAPAREIIAALFVLRTSIPRLKHVGRRDKLAFEVHRLYRNDLQKVMRAYFPGWRGQDLRALYGVISYHAFAPADMAHAIWLSEVLGHSQIADTTPGKSARFADTLTSAYYERFYMPDVSRSTHLRLP